ncbi:hypothetical protein ZEAMMB73_Zm00001d027794 [Zea mays]|uniref:Uncharacterized protein n=1 Tax=Zea mays TaxID=4577 RepID=A0A1D6JPN6_MAIZE|nr:hypothetical protein ZEAMMB73_Zm00001d027794 [Zea mays]
MQIFSRRKNEMLNILNKSVRAIGLERTCGKPISDLASFRFPHCRHTRVQPATNAPAGDWSLDPVCFVGKLQAPLDGSNFVCTEDQDTKIASFNKARLVRKVYFSEISKMKH